VNQVGHHLERSERCPSPPCPWPLSEESPEHPGHLYLRRTGCRRPVNCHRKRMQHAGCVLDMTGCGSTVIRLLREPIIVSESSSRMVILIGCVSLSSESCGFVVDCLVMLGVEKEIRDVLKFGGRTTYRMAYLRAMYMVLLCKRLLV
jgi:hypothetical protein